MKDDLRGRVICADGFHAPEPGVVECLAKALIEIGGDGRIGRVLRPGQPDYVSLRAAAEAAGTLISAAEGCYLLPGFIDLHIHAPQYPQLGKALHLPLETWLQEFTFPLEARYTDVAFARDSYQALVGDLLANGTTTALYFATIHQEATQALVDICLERRQRALIGKVAMDNPRPVRRGGRRGHAGADRLCARPSRQSGRAGEPGHHPALHPVLHRSPARGAGRDRRRDRLPRPDPLLRKRLGA